MINQKLVLGKLKKNSYVSTYALVLHPTALIEPKDTAYMLLLGDYLNVSDALIMRARYLYSNIDDSDTKSGMNLDIKEYDIIMT